MATSRLLALVLASTLAACSDDEGLAKARGVCLAPEGLDFGPQQVRTASTRTLAITSCGGVPIDGLNVAIQDPGEGVVAPFVVEATEVELPLLVGEHFLLPIRFRPTHAGDFEGALELPQPSVSRHLGVLRAIHLRADGLRLGGEPLDERRKVVNLPRACAR